MEPTDIEGSIDPDITLYVCIPSNFGTATGKHARIINPIKRFPVTFNTLVFIVLV
jgi:hypothetical protein